jgi:Fe(3+) dicitrate transport protein
LRAVPGVVTRDEEGLGLRPNVGIRGLNPTRSSKVVLLEDGLPLALAPYGDNSSYFHPPLERFERVEVLKGSGQIRFGPSTIGGVINYVTPVPGSDRDASLTLSAGTADLRDVALRVSGPAGPLGLYLSGTHRSSDGARDNMGSRVEDALGKAEWRLNDAHRIGLRVNAYRERSRVTYSGLTEAEWAADPFANAFSNDSMRLDRHGAVLQHAWRPGRFDLTTSLYGYKVHRGWFRQSSNSSQRPNDASDPHCSGMANLHTTCGNEGRVRTYYVSGVEPRLALPLGENGARGSLDAGVRYHVESQWRRQINGAGPLARTPAPAGDVNGGLTEANRRDVRAFAAFSGLRLTSGRLTLAPGLRVEHVQLARENRLVSPAVRGETSLTEIIPGLGTTWQLARATTLFAGVHRGFAPPRPDDVIDNASGGVAELDPERSWNYEAGVRWLAVPGLRAEATAFWMDFSNQIVPQSLAGGTGAALTNAGRTTHGGLELGGRIDAGVLLGSPHNVYTDIAVTWLPVAEFAGERYVYVDAAGKVYAGPGAGRSRVSVTGRRLPYAPAATLTAALGYARGRLDARLEGVFVGRQYGDALNTEVLVADGQQGPIPGVGTANASLNLDVPALRGSVFVAARNLFDRVYLADRTRGLIPGGPRVLRLGVTSSF